MRNGMPTKRQGDVADADDIVGAESLVPESTVHDDIEFSETAGCVRAWTARRTELERDAISRRLRCSYHAARFYVIQRQSSHLSEHRKHRTILKVLSCHWRHAINITRSEGAAIRAPDAICRVIEPYAAIDTKETGVWTPCYKRIDARDGRASTPHIREIIVCPIICGVPC